MTETRQKPLRGLHPSQPGRRGLYLLKNARHAEARRLLWEGIRSRLRHVLGRQPKPILTVAHVDPQRWLEPGDILLDAGGAELFWLERTAKGLISGPAPAIAFCIDRLRTARFGYHPVETVWLLEQAGYRVLILGLSGPAERPRDWYDAPPPGSWLLALPPGRVVKEAGE